jgi:hypothetical protein
VSDGKHDTIEAHEVREALQRLWRAMQAHDTGVIGCPADEPDRCARMIAELRMKHDLTRARAVEILFVVDRKDTGELETGLRRVAGLAQDWVLFIPRPGREGFLWRSTGPVERSPQRDLVHLRDLLVGISPLSTNHEAILRAQAPLCRRRCDPWAGTEIDSQNP